MPGRRLRKGQVSLDQQVVRLTEAYLSGVMPLAEYQRRRGELEQNARAWSSRGNTSKGRPRASWISPRRSRGPRISAGGYRRGLPARRSRSGGSWSNCSSTAWW